MAGANVGQPCTWRRSPGFEPRAGESTGDPRTVGLVSVQDLAEELRNKWMASVAGWIQSEIRAMHTNRYVWRTVQEIIDANDALPEDSYWWHFMFETYAVCQAVAVRRQTDTKGDVITIAKLVSDVGRPEHAGSLTRDYFLTRFMPGPKEKITWANGYWDQSFAGRTGDHLDPAVAAADLETMRLAAAQVKAFVDKHLAHIDTQPVAGAALAMTEIDRGIDVLGVMFRKYFSLFWGFSEPTLVPPIQGDWQAVFRLPWLARAANGE
jgi:hypothetical protein